MKQFYSSLIINSKSFPGAHQVFKPRFNKEYFKRITANIKSLETSINERYRRPDPSLSIRHLKDLRATAYDLVRLKENLERGNHDEEKYLEILSQLETLEDRIMPTVTKLPNRCSKSVPNEDVIVDELKTDFMARQNLSKVLSYRKLSYINNCYVKSVVGPNSHFYFGIGAKLQQAISNYFVTKFEEEKFIQLSGLCLTKSAVVEATNSCDHKEYHRDPARILTDNHKYLTYHLSESSLEALVGFLTTINTAPTNDPIRFMTHGSGYRLGSDWFDGDDKHITQFETLNTLTLNSSIEQYSMKEYLINRDILWSTYKAFDLPSRLVHCSKQSMRASEYDSHRIELWLPSRHEWLPVARVSHYRDYITFRVGMKRGHLIDACVFDGQVLVASIIENRQTALGKFMLPDVLEAHMPYLTDEERSGYFPSRSSQSAAGVQHNFEQRRFLTKRNYPFGHSKKAANMQRKESVYKHERILIAFILFVIAILDWDEIWYDYVPDGLRAFLYDYCFRPPKRVWFWLVCPAGQRPVDKSYAELDKYEYNRSMWDRSRSAFQLLRSRETPEPQDKDNPSEKSDGNEGSDN